jgi:hypothetical protein
VLGEALPENHELHHHVVVLPEISLYFSSPCWIKKEDTSPVYKCVECGGAVRSALDQIFRDLNRREYDSINRVHCNASA